MNWKIKAIINENGEDLYLGDIVNLGGETTTVTSINLINGMLLINGLVIDVDKIETDTTETVEPQEEVEEDNELKQLVKDANKTTTGS